MSRWSGRCALVLGLVLVGAVVAAEQVAAEKWLQDRAVKIRPAAPPVPALRYRLFPRIPERREGNAVPMYLRLAHERNDARKKELIEKPQRWNRLAVDRLPLPEVKEFVESYRYNYQQLDLGARRTRAEWNYALDRGNPIAIRLPDAQEMRMQAGLLVLKARLEVAEGRYPEAIRTLETGFSFSQQLSEAPFLINALIGLACANQFADVVLELLERPDAPNLYWALTVLPRPLIDLRRANEYEQNLLEMQFPDLADLQRPRAAAEWEAALRRVRQELERLMKEHREFKGLDSSTRPGDPASKSPDLPKARKYLTEVAGFGAAVVEEMPPAQVLLLYLSHYYHDVRDEMFRGGYVSFPQALPLLAAAERRLKKAPATQAERLVHELLPTLHPVLLAQMRIERKLAGLRAIEALRLHAASAGQLPRTLEDVKVAPVPADPGTGKPFEYRLDGKTAILTSRIPGQPLATTGLRWRVTLGE